MVFPVIQQVSYYSEPQHHSGGGEKCLQMGTVAHNTDLWLQARKLPCLHTKFLETCQTAKPMPINVKHLPLFKTENAVCLYFLLSSALAGVSLAIPLPKAGQVFCSCAHWASLVQRNMHRNRTSLLFLCKRQAMTRQSTIPQTNIQVSSTASLNRTKKTLAQIVGLKL